MRDLYSLPYELIPKCDPNPNPATFFPLDCSDPHNRICPYRTVPSTLTISDVLPPSSDTGSTCATRDVSAFSSSTNPLKAVPPGSHPNTPETL